MKNNETEGNQQNLKDHTDAFLKLIATLRPDKDDFLEVFSNFIYDGDKGVREAQNNKRIALIKAAEDSFMQGVTEGRQNQNQGPEQNKRQ